MDLMAMLTKVLTKNGLIFAFVLIGLTNLLVLQTYWHTKWLVLLKVVFMALL